MTGGTWNEIQAAQLAENLTAYTVAALTDAGVPRDWIYPASADESHLIRVSDPSAQHWLWITPIGGTHFLATRPRMCFEVVCCDHAYISHVTTAAELASDFRARVGAARAEEN